MSDKPTAARVWTATMGDAQCRSCRQAIIWAQLCTSGKKMPFDKIVVLETGQDETTRQRYQLVSLEYTHWGTCPEAKKWKGASRRGAP